MKFSELVRLLERNGFELIKEKGGRVTSSVSKNTDYLVVGESPGSKYEKASQLGVKMIGESELLEMIRP